MYGPLMEVTTERGLPLLLRPYRSDEAACMLPGMQAHSVLRTLSAASAQTLEDEQAWLERQRFAEDQLGWAICLKQGDRPIGSIGVQDLRDRRGVAGLVIYNPTYWGQLVARAAARALLFYGVTQADWLAIDSAVLAINPASWRLQESVGFVVNGRKPQAFFVDGTPTDLVQLTWVNPTREAWRYFWRGQSDPQGLTEPYSAGRRRAQAALRWAERNVTLL